jgi:exodeoxyribonuclease VII large subunit
MLRDRRAPQPELPFAEGGPPDRREAPGGEEPPVRKGPPVLSVGDLDRQLRRLVEGATQNVRVEGEISNLKVVSSGHAYFTLKDEREEACIDCVMYRTAPPRSKRLLADGARVVLLGTATVYIPRGRLQLIADAAKPAGRGAHLEALERLKVKLADEGLFAHDRKRPLPADPRVIGVVTSADGAAIHDIITVAFRRGGVRILLAPAPVQGPTAAQKMAQALQLLERVPGVEAIIVGRGGGSADDLSAYNDEVLVRQVAAARVPVVSAVGHEIDTTLTDLAADARAATPSQAAEMLVPDASARRAGLDHLRARMRRALRHRLESDRALLDRQRAALGSPGRMIDEHRQEVDDALTRMQGQMAWLIARRRAEITRLERGLATHHPSAVVARARSTVGPLAVRVDAAMRRQLGALRQRLANDAGRLDALSPLAVLARGYAIATTSAGRAIRDAREVTKGEKLTVRVHKGALSVEVLAAHPEGAPPEAPSAPEGAPERAPAGDPPPPEPPADPSTSSEARPRRRRK